jgi:hypothetical protein
MASARHIARTAKDLRMTNTLFNAIECATTESSVDSAESVVEAVSAYVSLIVNCVGAWNAQAILQALWGVCVCFFHRLIV